MPAYSDLWSLACLGIIIHTFTIWTTHQCIIILSYITYLNPLMYSISHEICTWFCCALFCCGYIDGLMQDCSNSIALAMELLQSCAKPSISPFLQWWWWIGVIRAPFQYKDHICSYRDPHCKDKAVMKWSSLYNRKSFTGKMESLYWNSP